MMSISSEEEPPEIELCLRLGNEEYAKSRLIIVDLLRLLDLLQLLVLISLLNLKYQRRRDLRKLGQSLKARRQR